MDVLVNNAGVLCDGQMVKVKDGELVKQSGGVILNASPVVGQGGNSGQTNDVATKAGVIGMTKVWARELGRYGVRANAVAPGFTATEILVSMPEKILDGMRARMLPWI